MVDVGRHISDVTQALLHVFLEAALHQAANGERCPGWQQIPVGFASEDRGDRIGDRVAREDPPSGQHFDHHAPERPDIGAFVEQRPAYLLWAHVRGGAEQDACLRAAEGLGRRM